MHSQTQLCGGLAGGGAPATWGKCNAATVANRSQGMIQEWLGNWGWPDGRLVGPMDAVGGHPRKMADGATIFALASLSAYKHTGDVAFLDAIWPHVAGACSWQMAQVSSNGTLPLFWNTYDYMDLQLMENVAFNAIAHLAGMRACREVAAAVADTSGLASAADASFDLVQKGLTTTLWKGTHLQAAMGRAWLYGEAVMSGSLHGQSWASSLGLGPLLPPEQLAAHVRTEQEMTCKYDPQHCWVGQQAMQEHTPSSGQPGGSNGTLNLTRWANDVDPAMTMDNAANAVWWCNASFAEGHDQLLQPALRMIEMHHSKLNDLWNWKDLHHGPEGETCGGASLTAPTGAALAGNPELNGHYTRQLQSWMIVKAAAGQIWDASARRLMLRPSVSFGTDRDARLPWFTDSAGGIVHLPRRSRRGVGSGAWAPPPRLEVHVGVLRGSVTVTLGHESWKLHEAEVVALSNKAGLTMVRVLNLV
eukprot:SAG22_NODE_410_length_10907_cov_2.597520_3_plen_475_part_00